VRELFLRGSSILGMRWGGVLSAAPKYSAKKPEHIYRKGEYCRDEDAAQPDSA
jgi:hypothetical protein